MTDALPFPAEAKGKEHLLAELLKINDEVDASAAEVERLSRATVVPDSAILSTARLRFSRALRRHLQHVDGAVLPQLRSPSNARPTIAVEEFRRLLHDYHEAAAHHVARWPSTSVAADWHGYRKSVADMLVRLRKRIEVERRDILPLLAPSSP